MLECHAGGVDNEAERNITVDITSDGYLMKKENEVLQLVVE